MNIYIKVILIVFTLLNFLFSVHAAEFKKKDVAIPDDRHGDFIKNYAPVFDFDNDGCYPASGISRDGKQNPGLKTSGAINGNCHDDGFLDISNTYVRYACNIDNGNEYCGYFFALYFEKDQTVHGCCGHTHDWEYVALWTENSLITHAANSAHGKLYNKPYSEVPKEGNRAKFVYHKEGPSTHSMRFAKDNEEAENHYLRFLTPDIVTWFEMSGDTVNNMEMRTLLNQFDYGSADLPINEEWFLNNLNKYKPNNYSQFTSNDIILDNKSTFLIKNNNLDECLLFRSGVYKGNELVINSKCGNDEQRFEFDGERIRYADSNYCLDIMNDPNNHDQQIIAWDCNNIIDQAWVYEGHQLKSKISGTERCIDVNENKFNSQGDQKITLLECNNNPNQKFRLIITD
ncbi:NPP1 family protein [Photobacterium profundum]|uniref:NPP1 family protein n=1 Tax=Photobacterium profundum TaxID=74109 RepID=UPI003D0FB9D0